MGDNHDLFKKAAELSGTRQVYETRAKLWYTMVHDGLRRQRKPWPNAADSHFPLIDMQIRKYKPFWLSQVSAGDFLATFIALVQELAPHADSCAAWFDFYLKHRTEFMRKLRSAVHFMLQSGRGVLKITWDSQKKKLQHEAVNPYYILMPANAPDFDGADWFVHVQHVSVKDYEFNPGMQAKAPADMKRLRTVDKDQITQILKDTKYLREGLTHPRDDNVIIVWEHYERTSTGWDVHSYCPQALDIELRPVFAVPYRYGPRPAPGQPDARETLCPFKSIQMEVKDEGWYSPRGLAELVMPFELYSTKLWNEKADAMTLTNRPLFTADNDIPNTAGFKWMPGEFIPGGIRPLQMPQVPFSFDQEINFTRQIAEQLTLMPDFGIVDANTAKTSGARTATENNRIAALQQVGTNDNGMMFREDLAKIYKLQWGILLENAPAEMAYVVGNELKLLPEEALSHAYLVVPGGATDEWDREKRVQRAGQRMQLLKGAPNVDQDELVKSYMMADDPRFAWRAFIPGQQRAAQEGEDEAEEILILKDGFPAVVLPQENHLVRVQVLAGWLQKQAALHQMGRPFTAEDQMGLQRVQEHMAAHLQLLKQQQPQAYRQFVGQMLAAAKQAQGQQGPGAGGPGGQGGGQMGPGGPVGQMPAGQGGA